MIIAIPINALLPYLHVPFLTYNNKHCFIHAHSFISCQKIKELQYHFYAATLYLLAYQIHIVNN